MAEQSSAYLLIVEARKRYGGKNGLITEREKRKMKKYEKELKEVKKMSS